MRAPTLFDAELALDRVDARLAAEMPAHLAASARAYAEGTAAPRAVAISSREIDAVLAASELDELRPRALGLLRVIVPLVIEHAPAVIGAWSAERTWDHWRALVDARDRVAHERLARMFGSLEGVEGTGYRQIVHALASVPIGTTPRGAPVPPPVKGWLDARCDEVTDRDIARVWADLRGAGFGAIEVLRSASAHPRTFVVERGVRAILVVPARIDTPAARFAAMHELGHAVLWLAPLSKQHEWPRALDEAAASYVARRLEHDLERQLGDPLARQARDRRLAIAHALDAIEAGGPHGDLERPPWALWNDPYAQAAYIEAEHIADEMPAGLRGSEIAEWLSRSR